MDRRALPPRAKIWGARVLKVVLRALHVFPVDHTKVFLSSYGGTSLSCSPKAIYEELRRRGTADFRYVWSSTLPRTFTPEQQTVAVKPYSLRYLYEVVTAGTFITNTTVHPFVPFRRSQTVINTWHGGGAYKKAVLLDPDRDRAVAFAQRATRHELTHFLSSGSRFSECAVTDLGVPREKLLNTGLPRNDLFFRDTGPVAAAVRRHLGVDRDTGLVLWAPTHRRPGQAVVVDLDLAALCQALEDRFGQPFIGLVRAHWIASRLHGHAHAIDVTAYPDMQELLCAADVLLTDYSSSVWDYSLTYKPCFLYAPDVAAYRASPGFVTPIEDWPFPLATNERELAQAIHDFDAAAYRRSVERHHTDLGSFEQGTAAAQVCDIIERTAARLGGQILEPGASAPCGVLVGSPEQRQSMR
jgi:CDP-glycerol glycerophosphotransferase